MPTKGPSYRYGNTRGSKKGMPTKHISFQWAKAFNRATLKDHFERHGSQVKSDTIESYEAHAVAFANRIDRVNNISFVDSNNSTYKYNRMTNEFAIINKKGYVITYFKPSEGVDYYNAVKKRRSRNRKK